MAFTPIWFSGAESGSDLEFVMHSASVTTERVKSGTYALKTTSGTRAQVLFSYTGSADIVITGSFYVDALPTASQQVWQLGDSCLNVFIEEDGTIRVLIGKTLLSAGTGSNTATGTEKVRPGEWNTLEIQVILGGSGEVNTWLNGNADIAASSVSLEAANPIGKWVFGPVVSSSVTEYHDDMIIGYGDRHGLGKVVMIQGKAGTPTYDNYTKTLGTIDNIWTNTPIDPSLTALTDGIGGPIKQTILLDPITTSYEDIDIVVGLKVAMSATLYPTEMPATQAVKLIWISSGETSADALTLDATTPTDIDIFSPHPYAWVEAFYDAIFTTGDATDTSNEIGVSFDVTVGVSSLSVRGTWLMVYYIPTPLAHLRSRAKLHALAAIVPPNVTPPTPTIVLMTEVI